MWLWHLHEKKKETKQNTHIQIIHFLNTHFPCNKTLINSLGNDMNTSVWIIHMASFLLKVSKSNTAIANKFSFSPQMRSIFYSTMLSNYVG